VILYKLLCDLPPERYVLISSRETGGAHAQGEFIPSLPGQRVELPVEPTLARLARFRLGRLAALAPLRAAEAVVRILLRARRIARAARRAGSGTLVACTGDLLDLPATWLASRRLGLRFVPYLFDDYTFQWTDPAKRALARWLEPRMFRAAAVVIAPNEFLARDVEARDGVACRIVRNAVDSDLPHGLDLPWPSSPGEIRIVYTGAVYHAHFDAFRNLVAAIAKLGRPGVALHLYTTQERAQLESEGIAGPVVFHAHVTSEEVREIQRRADVLFLPLAFRSAIPEVIRTSAPGKTGEYLASGRPVLVHAPADAFVSWYFRQHDCGAVVDEPDPARLAEALRELLDQPETRRRRAANALRRAADDFALPRARAALLAALEGAPPPDRRA
jgi:glycosyltransferase involved in cell wall biosynthesis